MPVQVWFVLFGLVLQTVVNAYFGLWLVTAVDEYSGLDLDDAWIVRLIGYSIAALAVVQFVCVVYTVLPRRWVRSVILVVEALVVVVVLFIWSFDSDGLFGYIYIGPALIAGLTVLISGDAKDWYRLGRYQPLLGTPH